MDLMDQSLAWRLRKVARYVSLYGPSATIVKVRSQYHMNRSTGWRGPSYTNAQVSAEDDDRTVAIVGCGKFAYSVIAHHMHHHRSQFLRWSLDVDRPKARSLTDRYGGTFATDQVAHIINDPAVDLVYISSNHASHAQYAAEFIAAGKAVHIEKPHAVTIDQLRHLTTAMRDYPEVPVFLGFNRPRSRHFNLAAHALGSEPGPIMINWFIAGHEIAADHWYFAAEEGGRVLGNLCHWLDLSLQLVGSEGMFPCTIVPSSPPGSDNNFVLTIQCADGSLVAITFSAKGHTFEGVRELMNGHRGSTLAVLRDFKETRIEAGSSRKVYRSQYRDHGHRANILNSYVHRTENIGECLDYIWQSGALALAAREALETGRTTHLDGVAPILGGRDGA